ncbi:MAG: RING finger domain-containing protein [Candidatus Thorarchaeota archaeon]
MSEKNFNFCPYCGRKLPQSNKVNYCCFCGENLKKSRLNLVRKIHCTICHEIINPNLYEAIVCPYCGSIYHSTCVSSWLFKYNACPLCQNVFIFPNKALTLNK